MIRVTINDVPNRSNWPDLSMANLDAPRGDVESTGEPNDHGKLHSTKGELQILEAVSLITVPDDVFKSSNIPDLISNMLKAQKSLSDKSSDLKHLREEKKAHSFLSNFWHNRNDKIRDAQFNLNDAIGELSKRSSDLLIVNTVIAKILHDQQHVIMQQQLELKNQADGIAEQNDRIKEQQTLLDKNQRDINLANEGLLEAKGLTQAQAQQLVGCVQRVESSEGKIVEAHGRLLDAVHEQVNKSASECAGMVQTSLAQFKDAHLSVERNMESRLSVHAKETKSDLDAVSAAHTDLSKKLDSLLGSQGRLIALIDKQAASLRTHRLVIAVASIAASASLAWLMALQFGLAR
jgi:hypothetical protein